MSFFIKEKIINILKKQKNHVKLSKIFKIGSSTKIISEFEGIWNQYLKIDGETFWSLESNLEPFQIINDSNPLPSDSIYRLDAVKWRQGNEQMT